MKRLKSLWQMKKYCRLPSGAVRMNCLAVLICLTAFVVLGLSFHATPAGAGLDVKSLSSPQLSIRTASTMNAPATGAAATGLSLEEINRRISSAVHGSRLALQLHVALLEVGKHRLEKITDYTATFIKQERLDGEDIQDIQTVELKMRHQPFSVYMKWLEGGDVGRQVLFVDGQYDNLLQVKLGGKKQILPSLKLDPNGSLAMKEARHPVTELGLLQLAELILKYRKRDLDLKSGVRWELIPDQKFMDRHCDCFVSEYDSSDVEPVYRKTITFIDKELCLPICVKTFKWPEADAPADSAALDEATMIEYYGYTDVKFDSRLGDSDFDKSNYKFRR